ncbi:hypothetical protein E4T66_17170 [Sinimarinibacterium sp. CAU 1509]|uniref:hypothetical protein n=1 Tax=Sinimarinibacterium sp. CAU 1509 TaxID=2562283 RepID=UPI0010AB78BA|nr:hypothetical protein [Sinimarinibacterium sp. CAU 1509]TJY57142.1 hypothetical protein E4T66_17170 [Sinimarinibacterium sp. CAU 1509]
MAQDAPMISLTALHSAHIAINAALAGADDARAKLEAAKRSIESIHADRATRTLHIEQARKDYCTDDIEIDDEPIVSVGDGGVWVNAWVWVRDEEVEGE